MRWPRGSVKTQPVSTRTPAALAPVPVVGLPAQCMVMPAQQRAVGDGGVPTVGPVPYRVVDLAPRGRLIAARVDAVLVSGDDGAAHLPGDGALGASDVQGGTVGAEYDPRDAAVAGQAA